MYLKFSRFFMNRGYRAKRGFTFLSRRLIAGQSLATSRTNMPAQC
jgi:hypothetical protein